MRLLKTAWFDRFANSERISDVSLIKARVARQGQGKSGGYRKLVFFEPILGQYLHLDLRKRIWQI